MEPTTLTQDHLATLLRVADLAVPRERHPMLAQQFSSLLAGALELNRTMAARLDLPPITQFGHIVPEWDDQP